MKSLLAQNPEFQMPPGCTLVRNEVKSTFLKDGRIYEMVIRDTVAPEDPYLVLVQAAGFAIQEQEPYNGRLIARQLKDYLIKNNLQVQG